MAFGVKTKREAYNSIRISTLMAHGTQTGKKTGPPSVRAGQGTREARPAQGIAIKYLYRYLHFKSAVELAPVFRRRPVFTRALSFAMRDAHIRAFVVVDYKSLPLARSRVHNLRERIGKENVGKFMSFERRARESIRTFIRQKLSRRSLCNGHFPRYFSMRVPIFLHESATLFGMLLTGRCGFYSTNYKGNNAQRTNRDSIIVSEKRYVYYFWSNLKFS